MTQPEDPGTDRPGNGTDALPNPSTRLGWVSQFGRSAGLAWRQRHHFDDVERFCFFIGYPRSGHSLVGSFLNAHPDVVISHELDALGHVRHHFGRSQLYALILERDAYFASMDRRWMGYDYVVPDQFQGRSRQLRVIGDKRARTSTYWLGVRPQLLDRLRTVVGVPLRIVHVTRDPYDNIATMARRLTAARNRRGAKDGFRIPVSVPQTIDRYDELCRWVEATRRRLRPDELHEVAYEHVVADPRGSLDALCRFLGVEADEKYLADCASIVWPSTRRTRDKVEWSAEDRRRVDELIARYPFLAPYADTGTGTGGD